MLGSDSDSARDMLGRAGRVVARVRRLVRSTQGRVGEVTSRRGGVSDEKWYGPFSCDGKLTKT